MGHHDRHVVEARRLRLPALDGRLPSGLKIRFPSLVVTGVRGIDPRETRGERLRDDSDVARVELHVRVTLRVDVTHSAVDGAGHFDQLELCGRLEIAWGSRLDLPVARLLEQDRQPTGL